MATSGSLNGVEALVFDVFGTVVDWRGSVSSALHDQYPDFQDGMFLVVPIDALSSLSPFRLGRFHK